MCLRRVKIQLDGCVPRTGANTPEHNTQMKHLPNKSLSTVIVIKKYLGTWFHNWLNDIYFQTLWCQKTSLHKKQPYRHQQKLSSLPLNKASIAYIYIEKPFEIHLKLNV